MSFIIVCSSWILQPRQPLFHNIMGKPAPERLSILDFNEARDDKVAVASAGPYAIISSSLPADNHASPLSLNFLQAGCPSWCTVNSAKALEDLEFYHLFCVKILFARCFFKAVFDTSSFRTGKTIWHIILVRFSSEWDLTLVTKNIKIYP